MKKGFTMVELIAVIAVLGLLMVILIPSVLKTSKNADQVELDTKVAMIEAAAVSYGIDQKSSFFDSICKFIVTNGKITGIDGNAASGDDCAYISISELAEHNYIKYDKNNKILNPVTKHDIKTCKIAIYKSSDDKNIHAWLNLKSCTN